MLGTHSEKKTEKNSRQCSNIYILLLYILYIIIIIAIVYSHFNCKMCRNDLREFGSLQSLQRYI